MKGNKPKHSAIYPPKLVERIIECSTSAGDVVFDPFAGTGTTRFVGEAMERRSVGIELNQEYIDSHDDRRENIAAKLERVRERYVQKENRKRQFEQATWDLIHHGYPKFLMSGLRTELNHLNFPSKLWDEIESSVSWGGGSNLSELEIGDGTEPVKEALKSETPISTFLRGIRESLQLPPEAEEPLDDRSREQLQRRYVDNLLKVWDPTTLIEELLSAHSDDTAPQTLTSGPGDRVVELYWQGAYKDCAERVLEGAEDSAAEVVRNLSISVGSGDIHGYLQPSKANLDVEFKGDNPGDGFDSSIFGVGVLMAGVGSLDASGKTDVSVFEPVLPAYEAYGKRCGVATIIVDPDTKYGVPENKGENPGVTYHLLLKDGEREVDLDNFKAAFARLREYPSRHSYNTQKIRKHSLDVTIDCRSAVDAHQVLSDVKGWGGRSSISTMMTIPRLPRSSIRATR